MELAATTPRKEVSELKSIQILIVIAEAIFEIIVIMSS